MRKSIPSHYHQGLTHISLLHSLWDIRKDIHQNMMLQNGLLTWDYLEINLLKTDIDFVSTITADAPKHECGLTQMMMMGKSIFHSLHVFYFRVMIVAIGCCWLIMSTFLIGYIPDDR